MWYFYKIYVYFRSSYTGGTAEMIHVMRTSCLESGVCFDVTRSVLPSISSNFKCLARSLFLIAIH